MSAQMLVALRDRELATFGQRQAVSLPVPPFALGV